MRTIGSINLNLGLVNIPLKINSFLDYKGVSFCSLCPKCNKPINQVKICKNDKCENYTKEIPYNQLISGYYLGKDMGYKVIDKSMFDNFSNFQTRIVAIVDNNSCPNFLISKTYILTPPKEITKPYFLLKEILNTAHKELVIEYMFRKSIHLGLIKPISFEGKSMLMLYNILYSDKIKNIEKPKEEEIKEEELKLGLTLLDTIIANMNKINFMDLKDRRKEMVNNLLNGKAIEVVKPIVEDTHSLIDTLKSSLEQEQKKEKEVN